MSDHTTYCANCGHSEAMHSGLGVNACAAWVQYTTPPTNIIGGQPQAHRCYCTGFQTPFPGGTDADDLAEDVEEEFVPRTAPFEFSADFTSLLGEQPTTKFRIWHAIPVPPVSDTTGTFPPYRGCHADHVITLFRVECLIDALPIGRREAWARLLWGMVLEPIVGGHSQGTFIPEQRRVVCEECARKALTDNDDIFTSEFNPRPHEDHPELFRAYVEMHPDMNVRESGILVPWRYRFEVKLTWDNPENSEPIPIGALRVVVKGLYIEHEDDRWPVPLT